MDSFTKHDSKFSADANLGISVLTANSVNPVFIMKTRQINASHEVRVYDELKYVEHAIVPTDVVIEAIGNISNYNPSENLFFAPVVQEPIIIGYGAKEITPQYTSLKAKFPTRFKPFASLNTVYEIEATAIEKASLSYYPVHYPLITWDTIFYDEGDKSITIDVSKVFKNFQISSGHDIILTQITYGESTLVPAVVTKEIIHVGKEQVRTGFTYKVNLNKNEYLYPGSIVITSKRSNNVILRTKDKFVSSNKGIFEFDVVTNTSWIDYKTGEVHVSFREGPGIDESVTMEYAVLKQVTLFSPDVAQYATAKFSIPWDVFSNMYKQLQTGIFTAEETFKYRKGGE